MNTVKCEKPEFTEEMRAKLNKMYKLLKERFYSKQELMGIFALGERQIRMIITEISHRFPVISTSGTNAGYKIATSEADLELVEHTWGNSPRALPKSKNALSHLLNLEIK